MKSIELSNIETKCNSEHQLDFMEGQMLFADGSIVKIDSFDSLADFGGTLTTGTSPKLDFLLQDLTGFEGATLTLKIKNGIVKDPDWFNFTELTVFYVS